MDPVFVVTPLLLIATVLYVAYPLLQEKMEEEIDEAAETDAEKILLQKEEVIANLKDIEMDYRMGKLTQQDYMALKTDFERRAVEILRKLESVGPSGASRSKRRRT